jgi:hypothetical protein
MCFQTPELPRKNNHNPTITLGFKKKNIYINPNYLILNLLNDKNLCQKTRKWATPKR